MRSEILTQNQPPTPLTGDRLGGTAPLSYSVSPLCHPGCQSARRRAAITGTPTATGSTALYYVTVTDANGATGEATSP